MIAGCELDALVAEKAMGKKYLLVDKICINGRWAHIPTWIDEGEDPASPNAGRSAGDKPPRYSTDIAAAWQVVEQMHERGLWMRLQSPFEANDRAWNAGFTEHSFTGWNGRPEHTAQADTAPRAICLAALKAVAAA